MAVQDLGGRLERYVAAIRASPHNLLSPRGLAELDTRHVPESLAFTASLPGPGRLLDIGSGGGFPGIVIALARPDLEVHLMEATGKKADFLADVVRDLELGVTVHHGRAEELASSQLAGTFDVVTARAVAPLERLAPLCAPYLGAGGELHAIKGERWAEELDDAKKVLESSGLRVIRTPQGDGSDADSDRPLVVVLGRSIESGRTD